MCFSLGLSGRRNISAVHPEQSVQRKESLWRPHSLDGVRTGTYWCQSFWQNHYSSHFHSADMKSSVYFFVVPRPRIWQPLRRQSGANSCQSRLPRGKSLLRPQHVFPFFNESGCTVCDWFSICSPDGLRLQSSPAAADVLWGQVSHHGWEHTLKSQWDHLRQQWGKTIKCIQRQTSNTCMTCNHRKKLWQWPCCCLLLSRQSVCWRRWSLLGRSSLLCSWSWVRGEQRDWTI